MSADLLASLASAGETGLGRAYPIEPDTAIDRIERDLALVASGRRAAAAHLRREGGTVARAIALEAAAAQPALTPYDGVVDAGTDGGKLDQLVLAGQRTSATNVQRFAACPYRHLLDRGFRLRKWEEPKHVYQLDGKAWGGLYHAVVARLFARLRDTNALPLRAERIPEAEREAARIVDEVAAEAVAQGAIRNAALIEPAKGRLRMEIAELLEREATAADGFVPIAFEQRYQGFAIAIAPGRTVTFQGSLDRIDEKPEPRTVRVIDYKTGDYHWKADEQFRGGRELQLAIYNQAVKQLQPGAAVAEARYYHATADSRFRVKACPATERGRRDAAAGARGPRRHRAARRLRPGPRHLRLLRLRRDLRPRQVRESRFERKKADPRLATFLAIRGIA